MPFIYRVTSDGAALRRWAIGNAPLSVGRGEQAGVRIPDYRMSDEHFTVWREGHRLFIRDLVSKNGTWVNGHRIRCQELKWNDLITAGRTCFSFEPGLTTVLRTLEGEEHAGVASTG